MDHWINFLPFISVPRIRLLLTPDRIILDRVTVANPAYSLSPEDCSDGHCLVECKGGYACAGSKFGCPADHTCTIACTGIQSCIKGVSVEGPGISKRNAFKELFLNEALSLCEDCFGIVVIACVADLVMDTRLYSRRSVWRPPSLPG